MKKVLLTASFLILAGAIFSFNSNKVFAGSCTYTGSGGGDWATGSNWTGTCIGADGAPGANDDVTIPANVSTENNITNLTINSLTFTGMPSSTLSGNDLTIVDSINSSGPPNPITISLNIILGGSTVSLSTNNYSGTIDLNGNDLIAAPSVLPWGLGDITGSGDIIMIDSGRVDFNGEGYGYTGTLRASGNTILGVFGVGMDGADVVLENGATFYGDGSSVKSLTGDGTSMISPYNDVLMTPRYMGIGNGGINLLPGDTVSIVIDSADMYGADMLFTSGDFDIGGATLLIDLNYVPSPGDSFFIVDTVGTLTGIFDGLPDGSIIEVNGNFFEINYTENSVTLTVPVSVALFNYIFTSNPEVPRVGQSVVITSVWSSSEGGPIPTGTAELFDGSTSLGTVSLVDGVATFNIASFTAGVHNLTVEYSGDSTFGAAVSSPLNLNVLEVLANTGINIPINILILFTVISTVLVISIVTRSARTLKILPEL